MPSALKERSPKHSPVEASGFEGQPRRVPSGGFVLRPSDFPLQYKWVESNPDLNAATLHLGESTVLNIAQVPVDFEGNNAWAIVTDPEKANSSSERIGAGLKTLHPGQITDVGRGAYIDHNLQIPDDPSISRSHTQLSVDQQGNLTIFDRSQNGTFVTPNLKEQQQPVRSRIESKKWTRRQKVTAWTLGALSLLGFGSAGTIYAADNIGNSFGSEQANSVEYTPTHVEVQPGDTLSEIAERQMVSLDDLYAANPDLSADSVIIPGQAINLPNMDEIAIQKAQQELLDQQEAEQSRIQAEQAEAQAKLLKEQREQALAIIGSNQEVRGSSLNHHDPSARWELVISAHIDQENTEWVMSDQYDPYLNLPSDPTYDQDLSGLETPGGFVNGLHFMGTAGDKLPVYIPQNEAFRCGNNESIKSNLDQLMTKLPTHFVRLAGAELVVFGIDEKGDNVGGYWNGNKGLVMADCADAEISAEWLSTLMVHEFGHGLDTTLGLSDKVSIDLRQASGGATFNGESIPIDYIRTAFAHKETDETVENADLEKYEGTLPERFYTPGPDQIFPSRYGASDKAEHIAETIHDLMNGGLIGENSPSAGSPYHHWQNDLINAIETSENGWPGFRGYLEHILESDGFQDHGDHNH